MQISDFVKMLGRVAKSGSGLSAHAQEHAGIGVMVQSQIAQQGASDRAKSLSLSLASYADNAAFVETWANLSNWVVGGANGVQVSGGALYAGSSPGGSTSGMNKSFAVGASGSFRAVFIVNKVAGASTGGIIIGVSSDTAGGTPTSGAGKARGIYFSQDTWVYSWDQGVQTNVASSPVAGTYVVTVEADANYLSIVAQKTDGSVEYATRWPRAGFNINNLFIFSSDTRGLTGSSVGFVGARQGLATVAPRTGIEGQGASVFWSGDGTNNFRLMLPASYDSRIASPLAICFHGHGTNEAAWAPGGADSNYAKIANALLAQGYIVMSVGYSPSNTNWGAPNGINAYAAAYAWAKTKVAFSSVVIVANSMGGIESLNALSHNLIPGVCAWVGTSPTYNLADAYANASFTSSITAAYGISGDYAAKTAGYDPSKVSPALFGGVPMMILSASDDTVIPASIHGNVLASAASGIAREVNLVAGITGGHSYNVSPYLSQITAFLNKYAS